jgi:Phosphotransferase enzyme family
MARIHETLPTTLDEITPDWVSHAISESVGVPVRAVAMGEPIHGTATNVRLTLEYSADPPGASLPPTMWLKGGFEQHSAQTASYGTYESEATFYQRLAPNLPLRMPACYYAAADPASHQGILLLEDLAARGVRFGIATEPLDADEAAVVLDGLARLHAATWNDLTYAALPFVHIGLPTDDAGALFFRAHTPDVVAEWIERRSDDVQVPPAVNKPDLIVDAFWRLVQLSGEGPLCFIHSDAHVDNIYFDGGSPGYLDFQALYLSSWAWDVSYFVVKSMEIGLRRRSEAELLRHYLDRLASYGVTPCPSFYDAWLAYRRYVAYALFTSIVNPDLFKPKEINVAWMSRSVAAADDLDTLGALGQ